MMNTNEIMEKEIHELLNFVSMWEEKVKKLRAPTSHLIRKDDAHPKYYTVEYQQACQQILNDLGELFFSEGRVNIDEVEQIVIRNLDERFPRTQVSSLMGISIRTVRNKLNDRG
jgi:hypothetical protein